MQSEEYTKQWKQVDSLVQKGLPKSALKIVNNIYLSAKKSDNAAQLIKSLLYRVKLKSTFEEDALVKDIEEMEEEMEESRFPVKPVLQSILAELYWMYYQQYRYEIMDRTVVSKGEISDIRTWDARMFTEKAASLYLASLENEQQLKKTPLKIYDAILVVQKGSRRFRPTLYDFLAHRAVDFFMNEESDLTRPAYQFKLSDEALFLPAEQFVKTTFISPDTLSFKLHALQLLQDLIAFHLKDKQPDALVDVDLKRLKFVHQHAILEKKDSLYIAALEKLERQYETAPISTWCAYERALVYYRLGNLYQPTAGQAHKWDRREAYKICMQAIERFPKSEGAQNCRSLQTQIQAKELSVNLEKVNLPDQPFRALVTYRNVKRIYLRLIPESPEQHQEMEGEFQKQRNRLKFEAKYYRAQPAAAAWDVVLPLDGDYQTHRVEIKMPPVKRGRYVVLMGTDPKFSTDQQAVAIDAVWISRLGFVQTDEPGQTPAFYVFDREIGKPLEGVAVQIWQEAYNPSQRRYGLKKVKQLTSGSQGFVSLESLPEKQRRSHFRADFRYQGDRLFLDDYLSGYPNVTHPPVGKNLRTFFFTDRTIYRPGQTVYFKGIVIEGVGNHNRIKTDTRTTVELYDANHQKVTQLVLTTNEYGTFSGTFILPAGGITGNFSIHNESGSTTFSVEEYKRPSFEATFQPITGSFRLNDTVTVRGSAQSYSGAAIDQATVQYRVVRKAFFPYLWFERWIMPYYREEVEIANGVTTTNEKGEFNISFVAQPDARISKDRQPVFHYTVSVDVTDISGETHSSQTVVTVGYVALAAEMTLPETVNREEALEIPISTKNLNGEFVTAEGTVSIYALQDPGRIFRSRLWTQPDTFVMSREEYYRSFPHDVYDNEDDFRNWEQGKRVFEAGFTSTGEAKLPIKNISDWQQGHYVAELKTRDAFGEKITLKKFFSVYSLKEKSIPSHALLWHAPVKPGGEPGETARFAWGSAAEDVSALLAVYHRGGISESRWLHAGKKKQMLTFPIREEDRGNFGFSLFFVKYGRVLEFRDLVRVPWSNKQLTITYETFRDKLKPGQPEEWRLRISGPKGEKVTAEMLAAMYDASLDAFRPHRWDFSIYPEFSFGYLPRTLRNTAAFRHFSFTARGENWNRYIRSITRKYDALNWFGFYPSRAYGGGEVYMMKSIAPMSLEGEMAEDRSMEREADGKGMPEEAPQATVPPPAEEEGAPEPQIRANLNETAFFFPHLQTDENGDVLISFTMPEALTRWKFLGFAHTKDLKYGLTEQTVVTQKELMVAPHAPRFFREGDRIRFTAKVMNLTDQPLTGTVALQLFNALTMQPVDEKFHHSRQPLEFSAPANQSAGVGWELQIPEGVPAVTYRLIARTKRFSDGEENTLPVLSDRILVTESLPLPVRGKQRKTFHFDRLLKSGKSKTLRHEEVTLEFTANPAWYAIQALPYMMEFPYECSEQIFSRYYANSIASHIVNSKPQIKRVFEQWKSSQALLSNLEKNQELKSLLLEETPWVLAAQDEAMRKKQVALLFDLNKMTNELASALRKLNAMQLSNGGFPWFAGGPDSRYITQHIVAGMGHLKHLGISAMMKDPLAREMLQRAVQYTDARMAEDYQRLKESETDLTKKHIAAIHIHYLYARSFFRDIPLEKHYREAFDYWKEQAKQYWLQYNLYMQGMIALALHRSGEEAVPVEIIKSLRERALHTEEMGMYWKALSGGYYWYQAPIETQALLIELFEEVAKDPQAADEMRLWLLKQKQTQDWRTTKATAEACYALLLRGSEWLTTEPKVEIRVGDQVIDPTKLKGVEAGSGYFKLSWHGKEITAKMGNVVVEKRNEGPAWGALYWQYFEQLDKISAHETPLRLKKQLFLQRNTPEGPVLEEVEKTTRLKPGDLLKVRIELRVDRTLEYVHMKDMRAAGLEPLNVFSQYKYQGGLGYYESTRDASTNFFFDYLPKGTYVFEYPLRVSHAGDFSNGITSIQCMYAPEFTAHSEGIRLVVKGEE